MNQYSVGVDIGGTNIDIGLINNQYEIVDSVNIPTRAVKDAIDFAIKIRDPIIKLLQSNECYSEQVNKIGIGVPGSVDIKSGTIEYANNLGLSNIPFVKILQQIFPKDLSEKIVLDNDANAAALGEYIVGKYHVECFIMITIGTGIGGGIIINGKLLHGINGAAGEFGHMVIDIHGDKCNCGRRGCFENYASAAALGNQMRKAIINEGNNIEIRNLDTIDAKAVIDGVLKGDDLSKKVFNQYLNYLAEGLANIINIFQPDVIVLSGRIMQSSSLFLDHLKNLVRDRIYSKKSIKNTVIKCSNTIADASQIGMIGAACIGMI